MSELSATMRAALDHASKNGGLVRSPGGYWGPRAPCGCPLTFGTSTINALVSRGLAEYTEWKDGRNGSFPIRMAVKEGR